MRGMGFSRYVQCTKMILRVERFSDGGEKQGSEPQRFLRHSPVGGPHPRTKTPRRADRDRPANKSRLSRFELFRTRAEKQKRLQTPTWLNMPELPAASSRALQINCADARQRALPGPWIQCQRAHSLQIIGWSLLDLLCLVGVIRTHQHCAEIGEQPRVDFLPVSWQALHCDSLARYLTGGVKVA